ncbi:MAG TPA: BTAD domain-containing putative transcriptional regulator, partial [Candidatus Eisenbacteria bacterium]|nr:BTAD domain-containing putative transcriptional regulator [Candidatus Eisenbacteria bacterium]
MTPPIATVPAKVRAPAAGGLARERLDALLARIHEYRLALVVAPAGSGKTTLLSHLAAAAQSPVAWYRAEIWDGDERAMVTHLGRAIEATSGNLGDQDGSIDGLLRALEASLTQPLVLVVDDLHTLEGSPAERALERLIEYAPPALTVLAASRVQPAFNLPRWRVSGVLLEIAADDLRFRPWEVERLFRDHYKQQLPPQELAVLTRRIEGWAAGLQLFHLATRDKSPDERRRILSGTTTGSRLTRDYLTRNVLADLSAELRTFLVETSVLGRLSGPICDALLDSKGSRQRLEELERRQIFTTRLDDDSAYRYHEVLRTHLLALLVEAHGDSGAQQRHRRAGEVLEAAGAIPEALAAYSHGEDWSAVERLLGQTGEALVSEPAGWLDALPASLVRQDPWLMLASARRARIEGRWPAALEAYGQAERAFGPADAAMTCRRERIALAGWLEPLPHHGRDWAGMVRAATVRDPMAVARADDASGEPNASLARGLAALAAGYVTTAREVLERVAEDEATPPVHAAGASMAAGLSRLLAGDPLALEPIEAALNAAERLGARWLGRLGRGAIAVQGGDEAEVATAIVACQRDGDAWGEGLIRLLQSATLQDPAGLAAAEDAAAIFHRLGSGTLEAWARCLGSLIAAQQGLDARDAALRAEAFARSAGAAGPRAYAFRALALGDPARASDYGLLAEAVESETGLSMPSDGGTAGRRGQVPAPDRAAPDAQRRPSIALVTLGGFGLSVDGRPIDLSTTKPRARALLRYLALHAGTAVHREVLAEALWPEGDLNAALRSLHVALSGLRHLLEPGVGRGGSSLLVRDGDAYRLELPAGSKVDFLELERAAAEGIAARAANDRAGARTRLRDVLDLYHGDLLPEDGPAEWANERREQLRTVVVGAAQSLAEIHIEAGEPADAAVAALAGLAADRYHDPSWRLLIEARKRAGDHGAAGRARREYAEVLAGLGLAEVEDATPTNGHHERADE